MTDTDNFFIDKYKNENFTINLLPTGLSDHDAQVLVLKNIKMSNSSTYPIIRRDKNKFTISEFKLHLSYESWDNVFCDDNVNKIFSNFLTTYLRKLSHSFPVKK
jgi:hypothetical protein